MSYYESATKYLEARSAWDTAREEMQASAAAYLSIKDTEPSATILQAASDLADRTVEYLAATEAIEELVIENVHAARTEHAG